MWLLAVCGVTLVAVLLWLTLFSYPDLRYADDPVFSPPEAEPVALEAIFIHGESLHLQTAVEKATVSLRGRSGTSRWLLLLSAGGEANNGLALYLAEPADYQIFAAGRPVAVGEQELPTVYTLPRQGVRKQCTFRSDRDGLLWLDVKEVTELPPDVYDVAIDPGHGGDDWGAVAGGQAEAEWNLTASLYMRECLEALGLKVLLTRESAAISGGEAAEENPYLTGARVDLIYRGQARYVFSNHLNAGNGHDQGFQIYSSVQTDCRFADAVADALRAAGAKENNNGSGLVRNGVYKRQSEWTPRPRDHYFIIRETGGLLLAPFRYLPQNPDMKAQLCAGAETLLMEYAFLDNPTDRAYWQQAWPTLVEAAVTGAARYWQLGP